VAESVARDSAERELDQTGERVHVVRGAQTPNEQVHLARYRWAAARARGRILDVACGTGYGSALLSRQGVVTGLDYDPAAIDAARLASPRAAFILAKLPVLPFEAGSFDAVVSFETIEHVVEDRPFLLEVRRVLQPGGMLLISTPNGDRPGATPNPWHVREYSLHALVGLLDSTGFVDREIYCQMPYSETSSGVRALALSMIHGMPVLCHPRAWWDRVAFGNQALVPWDNQIPMIWAVCARRS
jgi:SAM-dependent methyltransferase